jgi:hypothetical protein
MGGSADRRTGVEVNPRFHRSSTFKGIPSQILALEGNVDAGIQFARVRRSSRVESSVMVGMMQFVSVVGGDRADRDGVSGNRVSSAMGAGPRGGRAMAGRGSMTSSSRRTTGMTTASRRVRTSRSYGGTQKNQGSNDYR